MSKLRKVLLVEDEEHNRIYLESILRPFVNLTTVFNGKEALDIFRVEKFNLIITDDNMPIVSGKELIQEIRKTDTTTPIIVTSAFSLDKDIKEHLKIGASVCMPKPIRMTPLIKLVLSFLDIKTDNIEDKHLRQICLYGVHIEKIRDFIKKIKANNKSQKESQITQEYIRLKKKFTEFNDLLPTELKDIYKELYFEFLQVENLLHI